MVLYDPKSREEWLRCRLNGIGGSEAASIVGKNSYKSNVELWREKTGQAKSQSIINNKAVDYGVQAESALRSLFMLDFPGYEVKYNQFRMYANDEHKFIFATLDGEITDRLTGKKGILEIKTTTIQNSSQWLNWHERIPDNYYIQVLHQLAATGWDFVILKAHIRYREDVDLKIATRHYTIYRDEVQKEIDWLIEKEVDFWSKVQNGKEPDLILPEI